MIDHLGKGPALAPAEAARQAGEAGGAEVASGPFSGLGAEEFAALLCSRICHDLISPVGAIGNGVELMREIEKGPEGTELQLIARSAEMASSYLQFLRIAFGAAPHSDPMGTAGVARTARGWFEFQRPELDWAPSQPEITRAAARLLFNFMQIGVSCLPRGGLVKAQTEREGEHGDLRLSLSAEGPTATPPPGAAAWLTGAAGEDPPAPREVHYVAAAAHARAAGARIAFASDETSLALTTVLPADI